MCFFNFEQLNKAVTIPSLTKADLLNIEMPIPNILLQEQFADFVHQVDKSKFMKSF
ncbi:MAG: restriction endonuclease subunit S [Lachnospira eligens]